MSDQMPCGLSPNLEYLSAMKIFEENSGYFIGDVVYEQYSVLGPRWQENLQLVYVYSGAMRVRVEDCQYALAAGEMTLLAPRHRERFWFGLDGPTRHGWCGVAKPNLQPWSLQRLKRRPMVLPFSQDMRSLAAMAYAVDPRSGVLQERYRDSLIRAMLYGFLIAAGCMDEPRQPLHAAVERAQNSMEQRLHEPLTLAGLAGVAGTSPAHLIQLFKRDTGSTPKQYLRRLRIAAAERLLVSTGLSVGEIGYRVGFANPQHFSRVFSQHCGVSPGEWRRRAWAVGAAVER
ncbi:MAG: AraC family transcriptional regulator [Haliea sp.]|uniref:AraC family transcriptional regulator n=1 Tax=Haliea sp. TaxID=1932666 RepID=UPI0032EB0659